MERKILHIIVEQKFGTKYINLINQYFDCKSHSFIVFSKNKYNLINDENVFYADKKNLFRKMRIIKALFKESSLINVHFLGDTESLFLYVFFKKELKKINWVIWGGDLYEQNRFPYSIFKKRIAKECKSISCLIESDYEYFKKKYRLEKQHFLTQYLSSNQLYDFVKNMNHSNGDCCNTDVKLLLGNSATKTNNHLPLLKMLKENDFNGTIICPLSYGDSNYSKLVKTKGELYFKEKFVPIIKFMNYEDYLKMLSTIDFGFFGCKRQQALGNIIPLLLMGKRVFLYKDSPLYNEFLPLFQKQVFAIEDYDKIKIKTKMESIIVPDFLLEKYGVKKTVELWAIIFAS